ncbi:LysR family transcriptional regulator [Agarivorans sp. 1_MG-2023]|uniref:LysR family transcriptional regulator n=1 Tax=Agarivorans sp. 1_MG-2023 TaxID=3062634 RepID=UPI0026E21E52|nr:LysR family transcriptional regulator [Agarivorans sp. 1_MG-2023]MDO6764215.1 LysR family transcriptional regulator [Agarivorans sp. 1_MG-2023]
MNLQAIEAFVLSHQLGSISAAAKHMQKNRAQLSQWISNLEIDWNVELFTRSGHKPVLSEQGLKMLPLCEQMLKAQNHLSQQVEQIAQQGCFRLNLGVSSFLQDSTVAKILSRFNHAYPNVDLKIFQRRDELLLNWQGPKLDLAICFYRDAFPNDYTIEPLCEMPLVAVCSATHPLTKEKSPNLQQVLSYTWVTILASSNTQVWDPDSIQRQIEVEQHSLAIELCRQGVGVFVGQQQQLIPYIKSGELKVIAHNDAIANEQLGLIYSKHASPNPTLQALIKVCKAEFNNESSA